MPNLRAERGSDGWEEAGSSVPRELGKDTATLGAGSCGYAGLVRCGTEKEKEMGQDGMSSWPSAGTTGGREHSSRGNWSSSLCAGEPGSSSEAQGPTNRLQKAESAAYLRTRGRPGFRSASTTFVLCPLGKVQVPHL